MHHLCIFDLHIFTLHMNSSIQTESYGNEQGRKQSACMRCIYTKFVGETQICSWKVSQLGCSWLGVPAVGHHPSPASWSPPPQRPVTKESEDAPLPHGEETMPRHHVLSRTRTLCAAVGTLCWPGVRLLAHDSSSWLSFLFALIQKQWSPLSYWGGTGGARPCVPDPKNTFLHQSLL